MRESEDPEKPGQHLVLNYATRESAPPLDRKWPPCGIGILILGLALSCLTMILDLAWTARAIEGFQKVEGQRCLWDSPNWRSYLKQIEGTEVTPVCIMLAIAVVSTGAVQIRCRSGWMLAANILLHLAVIVLSCVLGELQRMDMGLYP